MREGKSRLVALVLVLAAAAIALANATPSGTSGTIGTNLFFTTFGFDPGAKFPKILMTPAGGGKPIPVKVLAATPDRIDAQVTKGTAGDYTVQIIPSNKLIAPVTVSGSFTIVPPVVTQITPTAGFAKTTATVDGVFFGTPKGKVTIGGKKSRVTSWTSGKIEIVVPKLAPGIHPVVVIGKAGTSTAATTFTVMPAGTGSGEFMRANVSTSPEIRLSATTRGVFFTATHNVTQDHLGVGVSKEPTGNPSIGINISGPELGTPMPYDVVTGGGATGFATCTFSDGVGSIYQAQPASDFKITVTAYENGTLAGTFGGTLTKTVGPGPATVTVSGGEFRAFLTLVGQ